MKTTASIPTYRHIDDTDRALPRKHATSRQLVVRQLVVGRQAQYCAGHALSRPVKQGSSPNPRYLTFACLSDILTAHGDQRRAIDVTCR